MSIYPEADCQLALDTALTEYETLRSKKAGVPALREARKKITTWETRLHAALLRKT